MLAYMSSTVIRVLTLILLVIVAISSMYSVLKYIPAYPPIQKHEKLQLPEACDYFLSHERFRHKCNASIAITKAALASSAGGCLLDAKPNCLRPDILLTHTWVGSIPWDNAGKVRALEMLLRSWLITQDLQRSRFYLWTTGSSEARSNGPSLPQWFKDYYPYVSLRLFDYSSEIIGTPLEHSRHFHSWEKLTNTSMPIATVSDVVRNVLLHNYGGIWLDNDAVPLRDMWNITAGIGLQLIPRNSRHSNNHILYIACPHSALAKRRLEHLVLFPYGFPDAWPRVPITGLRHWVYNDGLSEHTLAVQASMYNISHDVDGKPLWTQTAGLKEQYDNLEVPMPMGWFDPTWACKQDAFRLMACDGAFLWHRLTKNETGPYQNRFWQEVMKDDTGNTRGWDIEPRVLHAGVDC
mmetsp:Transcript_16851/g.31912  ORF Transcript_16851/g.31912 Transcript_16851/m.31912 type:complete len:408 (-) Transcript_16851:256-1479(-)